MFIKYRLCDTFSKDAEISRRDDEGEKMSYVIASVMTDILHEQISRRQSENVSKTRDIDSCDSNTE